MKKVFIIVSMALKSVACYAGIILLAVACSNPISDLQKAIQAAAADKVISLSESGNLNALLDKVLSKGKSVKMGTFEIQTKEDLADYLRDVKKCTIEGDSGTEQKTIRFDNFHIILENSVSMGGYIGNGNPDFAEPILALFECGDSATRFTTYYAGAKGNADPSVVFTPLSQNDFLSNISNGKFTVSAASPLDKMLSEAIDRISPEDEETTNDVFCFITDGILSGSNAEIAANRQFTKQNLPVLEKRIRDAIGTARNRDMHCLVYRLETPFTGTYYDYMNGKHNLSGGKRPYFMIVVGHRENLEKIESRLVKESNFSNKTPQRFASYDVTSLQTVTTGTLRAIPGQNGRAKGTKLIEYKAKDAVNLPVVFAIQMNLNSLPEYYRNLDELHTNLYLTYTDNLSGATVKIPFSIWPRDAIEDLQNGVYRFNVSLEPDIVKKMKAGGDMRLILPGHQDDWYRTLSCEDDSGIGTGDVSTFALDKFMGGIMKGYGYDDQSNIPDAILFEFNVRKK